MMDAFNVYASTPYNNIGHIFVNYCQVLYLDYRYKTMSSFCEKLFQYSLGSVDLREGGVCVFISLITMSLVFAVLISRPLRRILSLRTADTVS